MATEIIISKAGGPEVLQAREVPNRLVGASQVRVAVAAAGINFADVLGRMGTYPDAPDLPFCPGYEVSGEIIEIGSDVSDLAVGDAVCAFTRFGGYTDDAVADARACFRLPGGSDGGADGGSDGGIDPVVAAAIPVTHLTAYTCLFEAGNLRDGGTVLIHGGAGGVGTVAIQMARKLDVTIIATAGSSDKVEWMGEQGVHHPLNYNEGDLEVKVAEITRGKGVDVVLDPLGGRSVMRSVQMCAPLGRVILFGASSLNPGKRRDLVAMVREGLPMRFFNLLPLFDRNVGVHAVNMLHLGDDDPDLLRRMMEKILPDVASGALTPIIAERFPLTEDGARDAHHYIQDRKNIGKVLLVAEG